MNEESESECFDSSEIEMISEERKMEKCEGENIFFSKSNLAQTPFIEQVPLVEAGQLQPARVCACFAFLKSQV